MTREKAMGNLIHAIRWNDMPTKEALEMAIKALEQTGWIPLTYRPATNEEKKDYAERTEYDEEDIDTILNCQLPEDGETVLITDRLGNVEVDTFINDCDGCYFECNCDMEDVKAWMPLPKPYKESEGITSAPTVGRQLTKECVQLTNQLTKELSKDRREVRND